MLELAKQLAGQGQIKLERESAVASDWLLQQEAAMIAAMHKGVEAGKAATKITA
jgi:pantothenate kinase-related protein Tda10